MRILMSLGVDTAALRKSVESSIKSGNQASLTSPASGSLPLVKQAERILKIIYLEAKMFKSSTIETEHLLLSILKDMDNVATKALHKHGVDYQAVRDELENVTGYITEEDLPRAEMSSADDDDDERAFSSGGTGSQKKQGDSKSKTPVLDNFGRDLTRMAEDGKLDPIVGREAEIERVSQILSRRFHKFFRAERKTIQY